MHMSKDSDKARAAESTAAPESKPPKKRRWLLIVTAAIVLLAGGGGAAWYTLSRPASAQPQATAEKPPVFVNLELFTVNLQPQGSGQFAQVGLSVKMADAHATEGLKLHMPEIRNRILLLLSTKTAEDLYTVPGKEQLVREITKEIRQPLAKHADEVVGVFFTSFVIQ
jgi:flagellar FliL protein